MKQIDVANENALNPQINSILAEDMNKNPNDYYIWRTRQDDKVRGKHAEREGKIFNKHIPPEGGNPGEDYNCRCWAEPYKPKKVERLGISAKVDLSGLPQYAENDKSEIKSDVIPHNPNYISDEELYKRMWNNIKKFEGVISYPYLDSKGYITIGGGSNIDNYDDFMRVNFMVNGVPATKAQKLTAYHNLKKLSKERDTDGNYLYASKTADFFKDKTNLKLSDQDAYNMAQNHMRNDLAHVRSQFTDFDSFPNSLKEVLLDIQYNVIGGLSKENWTNLYKAIENRNIWGKNGIYNNINRKDVQQSRNDWAKRMIGSIRF